MIRNPENVLALALALLWRTNPGAVEALHGLTTALSLVGAESGLGIPEDLFQDLQQLTGLVEATRSLPPPAHPDVSLADVRALLAAFQRGGAR